MAFLIAELAWHRGLLARPLDIEQLVWRRVRLEPAPGTSVLAEIDAARGPAPSEPSVDNLVKWVLLQKSARGGEVRDLKGNPHLKGRWHEVPAERFSWTTVLSVPWQVPGDHINLSEARARDLAARMRAREAKLHQQRYLHLLDSQVNLAAVAKGRTGSLGLAHVHRRSTAAELAAGLHEIGGYVCSERNPADRGSRDKQKWARHRRPMAIEKAAATRARRSASESLRHSP